MSPAMGKTAHQGHVLHAVVPGIAIAFQQATKPFQEVRTFPDILPKSLTIFLHTISDNFHLKYTVLRKEDIAYVFTREDTTSDRNDFI